MRASAVTVVSVLVAAMFVSAAATHQDYRHLVVGMWQGPRHVRAFLASGEFILDPEAQGARGGGWKIVGDRLLIRYPGDESFTPERIIAITATKLTTESNGARYTWTRIEH